MTTMRSSIATTTIALLALACAACQSPPASQSADAPTSASEVTPAPTPPPPPPAPVVPPPPTAEQQLDRGVKSYEDGEYKTATQELQSALELGLAAPTDRARAHKYLAFMVCVTGREKACRDEFRMALQADPDFALAPAEAGHPVWGRVVRSVKAELAKAASKPAPKAAPKAPAKK
jgi:Tfp pilus assembly protein PilF